MCICIYVYVNPQLLNSCDLRIGIDRWLHLGIFCALQCVRQKKCWGVAFVHMRFWWVLWFWGFLGVWRFLGSLWICLLLKLTIRSYESDLLLQLWNKVWVFLFVHCHLALKHIFVLRHLEIMAQKRKRQSTRNDAANVVAAQRSKTTSHLALWMVRIFLLCKYARAKSYASLSAMLLAN